MKEAIILMVMSGVLGALLGETITEKVKVQASEIKEHENTCDNNKGVEYYGVYDYFEYSKGNPVYEVGCKDGAVFTLDEKDTKITEESK